MRCLAPPVTVSTENDQTNAINPNALNGLNKEVNHVHYVLPIPTLPVLLIKKEKTELRKQPTNMRVNGRLPALRLRPPTLRVLLPGQYIAALVTERLTTQRQLIFLTYTPAKVTYAGVRIGTITQ